ncbi:hypothetical protein JW868_04020 [Candidatus Woesearchaeota archaeon]|nr:hypothetical protein [Candidatus Woesearchaeota archaeon]
MNEDINDFSVDESKQVLKYAASFLKDNGIFNLKQEDQLIKIVELLAKLPWGKARTVKEFLITKKYGTCTAKHTALQACCRCVGIKCVQVICTFRWGNQGILFPKELQSILDEGEWDHGHNFLQIEKNKETKIDVDITWNTRLKEYGFKTFPEVWDGESSFIGLKYKNRWDDADMKAKKIELIESLPQELRERRQRFLREFVKWIHRINGIEK